LARAGALSRGPDYSVVLPVSVNSGDGGLYVMRCAPRDRARVLKAAAARLKQLDPDRALLQEDTFDQLRDDFFQGDRAMAGLLVGVCLALLIVTVTFGIALGCVLAFAINATLMRFYELGRLPFFYVPIGAVVLWCLGQIAILGPSRPHEGAAHSSARAPPP